MNIIKNAYLYIYLNNDNIECSECFDESLNRFDIINFYRNNIYYDKNLLINVLNNNNIVKYNTTYFLFTIDYHLNFHHCMTEMIGLLLFYIKFNNSNITVLIKNNKFVLEYLKLLNIKNIEIIEYNKLYYFNNIYVLNKYYKTKNLIKNVIEMNTLIRFKIIDNINYYEKIFLYRQNNKRNLIEINQILDIAKNNNFYIYSPENDNLENQIKLISNCKILLCELGAGCCNMFFTNQNTKIIILSFLRGWSDKYLYYNNGIFNRDINVLYGKIITGNEHNCTWSFDPNLLLNELKNY